MKNIIFLVFYSIVIVAKSYSQSISMHELINNIKCNDFNCFNTFITSKEYSLNEKKDLSNGKMYRYSSNKKFKASSNEEITSRNQASMIFYKDGSKGIGYGTIVQSQYKAFITELISLKFLPEKSIDEPNGSINVVYQSSQNKNLSVSVRTMLSSKEEVGNWTYYDFQIVLTK